MKLRRGVFALASYKAVATQRSQPKAWITVDFGIISNVSSGILSNTTLSHFALRDDSRAASDPVNLVQTHVLQCFTLLLVAQSFSCHSHIVSTIVAAA